MKNAPRNDYLVEHYPSDGGSEGPECDPRYIYEECASLAEARRVVRHSLRVKRLAGWRMWDGDAETTPGVVEAYHDNRNEGCGGYLITSISCRDEQMRRDEQEERDAMERAEYDVF